MFRPDCHADPHRVLQPGLPVGTVGSAGWDVGPACWSGRVCRPRQSAADHCRSLGSDGSCQRLSIVWESRQEREGALMLEAITSYVAVGDSFSEGLMDPDPHGEDRYRGWADRLALMLTESAVGSPDVSYANLAIRGRLLDRIIDEQIPRALEIRPDLVSLCAGGNDCLRPKADIDALAGKFE